jgi:acyl-coenzyme A synthetase/AMP-(fatty) acid ligase
MAEAGAYPLIARRPDEVLFRTADGPITAAAFLSAAHRLAAELPSAAHVLNLCRHRYGFALAFAAAALRGLVSLLSSDTSPRRLEQVVARFPGLYALSDDPGQAVPLRCYPVRFERQDSSVEVSEVQLLPAGQLAAIAFTSGSTGEPVGHPKRWGALVARSVDAARRFRIMAAAPSSVVGTVPAQHMYGFETTALLPLHAAASSWCGGTFYPRDVQAALEAVPAPRVLVTTPLQMHALLRAGVRLPELSRVISATAPLFPELAREAERAWETRVDEIFGATEVGSIGSRRTTETDVWTVYPRVRLRRSAEGDPNSEIRAAGPHTGPVPLSDVVELLDGTRFRLLGRRADMVKLGGRRASLAGLNRILTGIEGVTDGIFVAPDDLDQRPTARLLAYVVAPGRDPKDILVALRSRIDPVFLPRRVVAVSALPRNEFGKLTDRALKQLLAGIDES